MIHELDKDYVRAFNILAPRSVQLRADQDAILLTNICNRAASLQFSRSKYLTLSLK